MSEGVVGPDPRHRVARFVASTRADLDDLAEVSLWSMSRDQAAATLLELTRLRAQVTELELRVARHATSVEVGLDEGATSTANWWSHTAKVTRAEAHRLTRLASRLAEAHEPVRAALATGGLLVDQAAVIVDAIDALPTDLADPAVVAEAEAVLLEHARDHDAKALRVLGRRILDVVAPEIGEAHEARVLEAEEHAARAAASFTMVEDGHGRCHGRFTIPALHGQMLRKHLLAHTPKTAGHEQQTKHRLGEAFCEYVETRPAGSVGKAGGVCATVVVTMTLESLLGGLGRGVPGHRRPALTRRGPPARLPGRDHPRRPRRRLPGPRPRQEAPLPHRTPTDRPRPPRPRLHRRGLRRPTRAVPRPPRPALVPRRPHRHHTGRLLCPRHHTLAHDPRYSTNPIAHGKLRFVRRT